MLHSWNLNVSGENPVQESTGHLSLEVKKETERQFQPRDLQGNYEFFLTSRRVPPTELHG